MAEQLTLRHVIFEHFLPLRAPSGKKICVLSSRRRASELGDGFSPLLVLAAAPGRRGFDESTSIFPPSYLDFTAPLFRVGMSPRSEVR